MLLPSWVTSPTGLHHSWESQPNTRGLPLALSASRQLPEDFFCWRGCAVGKVLQRTQWSVWGRRAVKKRERLLWVSSRRGESPRAPSEPSPAPHPSQARRPALIHRLLFGSQGLPPFPGPCSPPSCRTPLRWGLSFICLSAPPCQLNRQVRGGEHSGRTLILPRQTTQGQGRQRPPQNHHPHPTPRLRREEPEGPR